MARQDRSLCRSISGAAAGGVFAGYDWRVTPGFDGGSPQHRELKERIEYSNAAPELATFTDVTEGLQAAGFEHIEARDHAPDSDPETPWYRPLEGNGLRGLPRTALGRRITSAALRLLERVRIVPKGSLAIQDVLTMASDSLVTAGRLRILTPMYFHKARKPA